MITIKKLILICKKCKKKFIKGEYLCFCDKIEYYKENINSIIKIQSIFRKNNISIDKDLFNKKYLLELIKQYNLLYDFYDKTNQNLKIKKMRKPNYPSEITENIVKYSILNYYNIAPTWDTKKGDLSLFNISLEVKGSIDLHNGGPCSFGPTEEWHRIYFVDAIEHHNLKFKVYEIMLSNKSNIWKNIKVNKNQTYQEQCEQGRRPRITFTELIKQIPNEYIKVIFNGNISEL